MSMLFKRIKDWAVSITSFRTGDVIPVDGPSGTAKMPYSDLSKEVIKDSANNTAATEADLVAGSKVPIMTANGPKALPGNAIAKATEQAALTTYAQNVAASIAPPFDPTRTSENPYKAGESVTYTDGKTYTFKVDHYGAWAAADVEEISLSVALKSANQFTDSNVLNGVIKELYFKNLSEAQIESIDNVVLFNGFNSRYGLVFKSGATTISSMTRSTAFDTDIITSTLSDGGICLADLSLVEPNSHPVIYCHISLATIDQNFSPTIKALLYEEKWNVLNLSRPLIISNYASNPSDLNSLKESGVYVVQRTADTTTQNFPSDFPTDGTRCTLEIYKNDFSATFISLQLLSVVGGYDKWWRVYNHSTQVWSGWTKVSLPAVDSFIPTSEYQLYGSKATNPADLNSLVDNLVMIVQRTADTTTLHFPSDFPTDTSRATLEVFKSKFDASVTTSVQVLTMLTDTYKKWWRVYNHTTQVWSDWTRSDVSDGALEFHVGSGYRYNTLRSAVEAANLFQNAKVIIHNGTYDLLAEYADKLNDCFNGNVVGVQLKNGIHILAMDGTKVTANVPDDGTYTDAQLSALGQYFNPFFSNFNHSFTLENLEIESTNTRYCVHDEHGGVGTYIHKYINCKMKFANTISRSGIAKYVACIGGGLGEHGTIVVEGGRYESHTVNGTTHIGGGDPENHQNCISYHNGNSATCDSSIRITGVYLADRGYIKFGYYGPSTIKSFCEVSDCSLGLPLVIGKETNNDAPANYDVVSWGNEQKVEGVHWEVGSDGYTQNLVND